MPNLLKSTKVRNFATILLCPYLAPMVLFSIAIAVVIFNSEPDPAPISGPSGSKVMGLYGIMLFTIIGTVAQVFIGIPLGLILKRVKTNEIRMIIVTITTSIPIAVISLPVISSGLDFERMTMLILMIGLFSLAGWLVYRASWTPEASFIIPTRVDNLIAASRRTPAPQIGRIDNYKPNPNSPNEPTHSSD